MTASLVTQIRQQAQQVGPDLLGLLFPSRCAGCQQVDELLCETCRAEFVAIQPPLCVRCGQSVTENVELCMQCQHHEPSYISSRSIFRFEGTLQKAIHALKYERRNDIGALLAQSIVEALVQHWPEVGEWPLDLVVAVPLHPAREAARGYNQSQLLAEPLAAAWGLPFREEAVIRTRDTPTQLGLNAKERRVNVQDAFYSEPETVGNLNVLLVDDVRTTGATLDACSAALLGAGAAGVYVLTLAKTV